MKAAMDCPSIRKPTWPDNGLIAVERYWTAMAGVVAGLRSAAAFLKVSGTNEMGEPNGEPTSSLTGAKVDVDLAWSGASWSADQ
jgi:hypothetical protein